MRSERNQAAGELPLQQPGREKLSDLLRWHRIPGGLRYMRAHGFRALMRRLLPEAPLSVVLGLHRIPAGLRYLRRVPGGLRYLRRYGIMALLRVLIPELRTYKAWLRRYDTIGKTERGHIRRAIECFSDPPLISVLMPVYDPPERFLRAAIDSVRRQLYPRWELCIADDASPSPRIRAMLETYRARDPRIKVCYRPQNGHISAASNSALALAEGEFVALLDHDDVLPEHALYTVAATLAEHPELDLIFSDEDKIDADGNRYDPYFKSDWNPDLMLSQNMFSHLGVYRRSLLQKIGGFRVGYEGSQDYDLALRAISCTTPERIRHIPHILYHWRAIPGSAALGTDQKRYALTSARRALTDHLSRNGIAASVTESPWPDFHRVRYTLPDPLPGVSIIVPTRDRADLLRQCMAGLLDRTDYTPIEILVVDNDSVEPATHAYFAGLAAEPRVRILHFPGPFSYSAINNFAVAQTRYDLILLLNNDIQVIHPEWLREMVSHAVRPEIGAVGAKLYYPDDTIQHAGVIVGLGGAAGHPFCHFRRTDPGYYGRLMLTQNLSAVTAACLLMRKSVFQEAGGLDEVNLAVAFNDVDLCLRVRECGYRILWTPYAELYHWESVSRGSDLAPERVERFRCEVNYVAARWRGVIAHDPYYNPNLALDREDFSLAFPPRVSPPWRKPTDGAVYAET